tara:strand:- start:7450 stop:7866 length:417 start_codon:yes stop_codon:yes gene_type:complete
MTKSDRNLDSLAKADCARLKAFAETLIADIGEIEVLSNRTGLVMLPALDTAQGTTFHLGEVLVSEAKIKSGDVAAYGMRQGHDLEASMAMALVDLAMLKGIRVDECTAFCDAEFAALEALDIETLRKVEATRINMDSF